ncbi:hypothetical protein QZH41_012818 [Actinostola sp. cb2023]|nr:hypothetical protein QZH41_012818 [Actinostola sp. cb2023]
MPMPSANGNIMEKDFGSKKTVDELKRQVSKLKAELESERAKLKQVHRDKTAELKRVQENYENERHRTVESATKRLQSEHAVELRRIRESLGKERDNELRLVLKFKEEELKALKQQIQEEKDRCKRAEDEWRKHNTDRTRSSTYEVERRLRDDITDLKEQKRKIDELYKLKCAADYEKAELIRRLKSEHEREVNALIRESKREVAKEFHHLRSAEKALEEKNHELAFKDQLTRKLEAEKQEIRQRKTSDALSDSPLRSRLGSWTQETEISPEPDDVFQSPTKGRHDKERELRKKNAELQSRLDQLEKKCSILEKENTSKHTGNQKASSLVEEKVKKLKKRNSELVSIARQLEEKAKKLQEQKNATMKQANSKADPSAEVEHMKKMFARQRAKDLAEQAKSHLGKDNEIEKLRKEVTSLSGTRPQAQNNKIDELQSIVKKTAKERLILEKKLALVESPGSSPIPPSPGMGDLERRLGTYSNKLKTSENDSLHLQKELETKEKEYENLKKSTEVLKAKCSKLELEREKFATKCTMLYQKNAELGKRMKELNKLEEEIKSLKETLQKAEEERHDLEHECVKLEVQLKDLMHVKEDLEASEQQRKVLETEHISSVSRLREREEEIRQLHKIQEESTRVHRLAVTSLENDVRALQQKCADSNERANNLKNELAILKTSKTSNQHKSTQTSPVSVVTPSHTELRHVPRHNQQKESKTENEGSDSSSKDILDMVASRIKQLELSDSEEDSTSAPSDSNKKTKPIQSDEDDIALLSRRINQATYSDDSASILDDNYESDTSRDMNSVADGDMADMEDNDITTSMVDGEETGNNLDSHLDNNKNIQTENKFSNKFVPSTETTSKHSNSSLDKSIDEKYLSQEQVTEDSDSEIDEENLCVFIARFSYDPFQHSPNDCPEAELAFQAGDYLYVFGDIDEDGYYLGELIGGQRGLVPSNFVEKIAGKNYQCLLDKQMNLLHALNLFFFSDESEMSWIVNQDEQTDEMYGSDEEHTEMSCHNKRCNIFLYCNKVMMNYGSSKHTAKRDVEAKEPVERSPPKVVHFSDFLLNPGKLHRNLRLNVEHIPDSNLGDIEEEDDGEDSRGVLLSSHDGFPSDDTDLEPIRIPSPKHVMLERQHTRSLLLSWKPADIPPDEVKGYGVYVNGDRKMVVKGGRNTKALIEDIDPLKTYRISVRTITILGEESLDQEAMLTIGKDASVAPSNLQSSDISPTSAKIEWLPGNSSYSHEILVNGTPLRTIRPGTYQYTLTNLEPKEHYRVHVRARNPKIFLDEDSQDIENDPLAKAIDFTTQKGGAPDPPLDVHLVPTPSHSGPNTLEVSWIPVTITEQGTSNGARVNGYKVYINDVTCAEVTSPTADCVKVASWMIERAAKKTKAETLRLTVRTQSSCGESVPSNLLSIPLHTFNFQMNKLIGPQPMGTPAKPYKSDSSEEGSEREGMKDDNHKESHLANHSKENQKNKNNKEQQDKPAVKPRQDAPRKPPVPKTRTKGRPAVWKVDDDDSWNSSKSDTGGNSTVDEDEQVEICHVQRTQETPVVDTSETVSNTRKNEEKIQQEQQNKVACNEIEHTTHRNEAELTKESQDVSKNDDETSKTEETRERKISVLSDIDLDELNNSLKSATSYIDTAKQDVKEPFLGPVDLSDSEIADSSDEPLSVIDEAEEDEEDNNGSTQKRSRSSRSHSASDGFRSDDDVMDLLGGEEPEDSKEHAITAAKVRRVSEDHNDEKESVPGDDAEKGLLKYLVNSEQHTHSNGDSEFDDGGRNQTYSDVEADQYEPTAPYETSTPTISRRNDHDEKLTQDDINESEVANTTYTLEEDEEVQEEEELIRIFIALFDYNPAVQSPNPDAEEEELAFNEGDLIKMYGDQDADGFYWGELDGRAGFVPHNMVSEVQVDEEDLLDRTTSSLAESQLNQYPQSTNDHEHLTNEVPSHQYPHDNVPDPPQDEERYTPENVQIPTDGQPTQYPKVIVHKPSDAGLHETSYQYPEDSNPVPHIELNETYEGDESSAFEDPRSSFNYSLEPKKMVALFDYDPQMLSPNPDSEVELKFRSGDILYVYGEMDEDGFYTGEMSGVRGLVPSNFLEEFQDSSLPSDVSVVTEPESVPGPSKTTTPNGTQSPKDEPPKKKKGLFSKGKQILKKMTKSQTSKK